MKLIHCADIHLNSSLSTHLDGDKQKQRRTEILHTFLRMVDYAAEQSVDGILIAGDLFDTKKVDRATGNAVLSAITGHPEILFFYLRGNHDADGFLQSLDEIPDNLKLFGDTWRYYAWEEDGATIVITGAESSARNAQTLYTSLRLNPKHINLVMLHGQETPYASGAGQDAEQIPLALLQNKGIDYLALGHIIHISVSSSMQGASTCIRVVWRAEALMNVAYMDSACSRLMWHIIRFRIHLCHLQAADCGRHLSM